MFICALPSRKALSQPRVRRNERKALSQPRVRRKKKLEREPRSGRPTDHEWSALTKQRGSRAGEEKKWAWRPGAGVGRPETTQPEVWFLGNAYTCAYSYRDRVEIRTGDS